MTATGLQPGAATTDSERSEKKPTAKARQRAEADDDEDGRTLRANQQRVPTRDAPSTAARVASSTTPLTTGNALTSESPPMGERTMDTPATITPEISAMAAAIRHLTAMVSELQPAEANEGE
ncbi:hypothetical protein PR003_g9152 [Phytophthora rubi]|uniref:Uncharacterized protein n=1 Tax=Phytophthora rubi TaxID=129364 RepID=A0A6A4FT58_9STRA|nr:hypothetical protein PR003_g9152 [Phytophthora rubi]